MSKPKRSWLMRAWDRIRSAMGRRGYDAADTGRRHGGWATPATSANAEIDPAIDRVRASAREAVRNDPIAANAVSVIVNNTVGEGIVPRSAFPEGVGDMMLPANRFDPEETLNERCDRIWSEAAETLDAAGQLNAYGQQIVACRGIVESGETLLHRHWRRFPDDGLSVPVQVELLEGDMLDRYKTQAIQTGGRIVQGVQFDERGRRTNYWLYPEHPGALLGPGAFNVSWRTSMAIPATEISHAYEQLRPGQVRGMSFLTPVLPELQAFSDYSDAELERKRMEACIFASVQGIGDGYGFGGSDDNGPALTTDADGVIQEEIQPGLILYPPDGAMVTMHTPGSVGGVAEFRRQQLISIAAGMRMVYTLLTGDLSGTNYSSIRAGLIEFRRFIRSFRQSVFVRAVCQPQWQWSMEAAQVIGRLPNFDSRGLAIRRWPARWAPPMFESVDRLKDAMADEQELLNATVDLPSLIMGMGRVPETVMQSQAKAQEQLKALGIKPGWMAGSSSQKATEPVFDEEDSQSATLSDEDA